MSRLTSMGAATAAALLMLAGTLPAHSAHPHPAVVSEDPQNETAELVATSAIPEPRVDALAAGNGTLYLGGLFERLQDPRGSYLRDNLAAVDEATGQVTPFSVTLDGQVYALATRGSDLYVGGDFATVNGVQRPSLVKINTETGLVVPQFTPVLDGRVNALQVAKGRLFVGGTFDKRLTALDLTTGADDRYVRLGITGTVPDSSGVTSVVDVAVSPTGRRLVAIGNFTTVSGAGRQRAFMASLRKGRAALSAWYYPPLRSRCRTVNPDRQAYLTDVDFAPDGSYFVLVSTGYVPAVPRDIGRTVCDAAARFETGEFDPRRPTWINYTGGDTLTSVAATTAAVYVQGHNRWLNNPYGEDSAGTGAVDRLGIGAIHPESGRALAWDPDKPAERGGRAFYASATGLWVGSDSMRFGGEAHHGLAFAPLP